MAHGEVQEREDLSEDTFLKNLYLYMKNRDTPIERIPHLGFKQIELYVMYKTVKDLGGYHQVTAQQMWKQVYNTLGGNPRSTSAATCTRRHYEKLLLPYECHVKGGELMNALPQHHLHHHHPYHPHHLHPHHPHPHPSKAFLYGGGGCHEDDGQRAAKRRPFLLHRNPRFPSDSHLRVVPLTGHYPHYFHPGQPVLPPYVPLSPASALQASHGSPVPRPAELPYDPSPPIPQERAKHPLEQLRYLAEQYKSSSGLAEPLNLSVKGSNPDANLNPASSFMSPPSSSKTPKFLNKPSPLYPPKGVTKCETLQDKEDDLGKCSSFAAHSSFSPSGDTGDVINLTSLSSAPSGISACPSAPNAPTPPMSCKGQDAAVAHAPCSPKTQFKVWPGKETEQSPRASSRTHSSDSHALPSPPRDSDNGKMEIQIPLSLLQDFFRHCRPSASATNMHRASQLPTSTPAQEAESRGRPWYSSDPFPANMNAHTHPSDKESCSSAIEDLSRKQRSVPNPAPASHPYARVPNHFSSYRQSPLGAFPKDAPSHGVYPWDRQDVSSKPYNFKAANGWHPHDRECQQAHPVQMKVHSSPLIADLHDFGGPRSPPAYSESTQQERLENGPASAVLHLTNEELMKLKRIISTSP